MNNLKILILGNTANDGYAVAKELRKMNKDVDLAINMSDAVYCLPQWEEGSISDPNNSLDATKKEIIDSWNSPSWIRYIDLLSTAPRKKYLLAKIKSRLDLFKIMKEYDIIEAHYPFMIYSQFSRIPYVVYDTGWIRYLPFRHKFFDRLARRGYGKAKGVIITNPDTFNIVDSLPYIKKKNTFFSPFAIDHDRYRPLNADIIRYKFVKNDEILLFSPARQKWDEKGNDKMIRAYAKFSKVFPNSRFIMVSWSDDEQRSKVLVNSLGISEKVLWIKPVNKDELIMFYNAADIVLDQFTLGSWGTATPEAMCCGKPVLMFYDKNNILRSFGEVPPILNSFTEDEIYSNLINLSKDVEYRKKIGKESREWVMKTHSPYVVATKHMNIINRALNI